MQTTSFQQSGSSNIPAIVGNIVMLCEGRSSDGKPYWAYVCMIPKQAEMFYQARKRGSLNLEDYGTILEWGEGEKPADEIASRMNRQFGTHGDVETALIRMIEQVGGNM